MAALVSILITNYNYAEFVRIAVESALAQDYVNIEVVVVDDGSTDGSIDVLRPYAGRVRLIAQPNAGQASAFNAAFRECRGQIVCLLDADDLFFPEKAGIIAHTFESLDGEFVQIAHRLQVIDARGRLLRPAYPTQLDSGDLTAKFAKSGTYRAAPTSGLCYRRAFLDAVTPVPTAFRLGLDLYFAWHAALGGKCWAIENPLGAYRLHSCNSSRQTKFANWSASTPVLISRTHARVTQHLRAYRTLREHFGPAMIDSSVHYRVVRLLDTGFEGRRSACLRLLPGCVASVWHDPGRTHWRRLRFTSWLVAMALLPASAAVRVNTAPMAWRALCTFLRARLARLWFRRAQI
jgi:glycosyltransferase involved in cell wall biosynthesis